MLPQNPTTAIVTDSTADIPVDLINQFQIHVIPNVMVIDGQSLEDNGEVSRVDFYNRLPGLKTVPTTATASSGSYERLYEKLLGQGFRAIVSIHAASALSGIYNAASLAASHFGESIRVVDSKQVSMGLGFQVLAAAEAAARGVALAGILESVQRVSTRIRLFAMLDTLEYVRRSGRVSWARARLGNLLHVKPFIEVKDGKVLSIGETRTRRKGIDRLKEILINQGQPEKLAILHTNAEPEAIQLSVEMNERLKLPAQPFVVNITTIIGVHTGPNGLGFSLVLKE